MVMLLWPYLQRFRVTMFGIYQDHCAAMDGGERRGRHVQGWTFDPQLRQHKEACGGAGGVHNRTPPAAKRTRKTAPVGAPTRDWPLLTGLCDSHRSQDGANLGPPGCALFALTGLVLAIPEFFELAPKTVIFKMRRP